MFDAKGYTDIATARDAFGVVIDGVSKRIDVAATEELRKAAKKSGAPSGKSSGVDGRKPAAKTGRGKAGSGAVVR